MKLKCFILLHYTYRNSDEDDESNSFELETVEQAFGNLQVFDAHNANMSPIQGLHLNDMLNDDLFNFNILVKRYN